MSFVSKIDKYVRKIQKRSIESIHAWFKISIRCKFDGYTILLPYDSVIKRHQTMHRKYDRFLPHIVSFLVGEATVIDVGANVGDSLAAMAEKNISVTYICIEAFDDFFKILEANVERIRKKHRDLNVHIVRSLVGKNISNAVLEGSGGSKHVVLTKSNGIRSKTLDDIQSELDSMPEVRLIKSDVDGFDYDVIASSIGTIRKSYPLIFFECQFLLDFQVDEFQKMMAMLRAEGYDHWAIFDNFGELIIKTQDLDVVYQLIEYVRAQNEGKTTRTIWYFDILASHEKDNILVDEALKTYSML